MTSTELHPTEIDPLALYWELDNLRVLLGESADRYCEMAGWEQDCEGYRAMVVALIDARKSIPKVQTELADYIVRDVIGPAGWTYN